MNSKKLAAELEKRPFVPLRIHMINGKSLKVSQPNTVWLLQNSLMILRGTKPGKRIAKGYEVVAIQNIERIEQLKLRTTDSPAH